MLVGNRKNRRMDRVFVRFYFRQSDWKKIGKEKGIIYEKRKTDGVAMYCGNAFLYCPVFSEGGKSTDGASND